MRHDDGDGFLRCACGHLHWGLYGAAGLLLRDPERGVLLQCRAEWTHHGQTWALPGGAVRGTETPSQAACREAEEEAAVPSAMVHVTAALTVDHGTWSYSTVLATARATPTVRATSAETAELRWVDPREVASYPLHPDFGAAWPMLADQLDRELVLIVDAANVVGARPDGWWRDRAGAAVRLRDRLAPLARVGVRASDVGLPHGHEWSWWPRIVLVVEGRARATAADADVEVVAAERDGDAAIVQVVREARVEHAEDHIVVVTADRQLRARVTEEGAAVIGPASLLDLLDAD